MRNLTPVPGTCSLTTTWDVEYPTPPLATVTLSTLPSLIEAITLAPTPSPKIVRSGGEIYPSPLLVMITESILPSWTIALYSEEDPEETLTVGGIAKLKMVEEP